MIGELTDQPPFLVRKLGAQCASSRRLLALTHSGKLQGEDAAKLVLGFRVGGEERIGAVDQHSPKLERLSGKADHPITAFHHLRPHVVERSCTLALHRDHEWRGRASLVTKLPTSERAIPRCEHPWNVELRIANIRTCGSKSPTACL